MSHPTDQGAKQNLNHPISDFFLRLMCCTKKVDCCVGLRITIAIIIIIIIIITIIIIVIITIIIAIIVIIAIIFLPLLSPRHNFKVQAEKQNKKIDRWIVI